MSRARKMAVVGLTVIAAFGLLFLLDPARASVYPPCLFHRLTGWRCPGCGSTRALHQLAHGHLWAAFELNPLAILLVPLVGYLAVRRQRAAMRPLWIWTLLGLFVAFGVLRNIPAYPFTLLAP